MQNSKNPDGKQIDPITTQAEQEGSWKDLLSSRVLLDSVHETIAIKDLSGVHRAPSSAMCELVGKPESYIIGRTDFDLFPYEQAAFYEKMDREVIETQEPRKVEEQVRCQNSTAWMQTTKSPLFDQSGQCMGVIVEVRDVTEGKQMEEALRRSENYYRTIFETSGTAMCILEQDTTISLVNYNFENICGYSQQELEGKKSWIDFIHPRDLDWVLQNHYLSQQDPDAAVKQFELSCITRQGEVLSLFLVADFIPESNQIIASCIDITELKQMEKELQQRNYELIKQEALYRSLVEDHPYSIDIFLPDTTMIFVNNYLAESIGCTPQQLKGRKWINFLHQEEREHVLQHITTATPEFPLSTYESSYLDKDGNRRWNLWSNRVFFNEQGEISYVQGVGIDITERKRAEAALQESEKKFRNIFNSSSDMIFIHDINGRFLEVNDVSCERLGYTRQELLGRSPNDIETSESAGRVPERLAHLHQVGSISFEANVNAQDGQQIPVEVTSRLIDYEGETCILSTVRDITERKQSEEELQRYRYLLDKSQEIAHLGSWEFDVGTGKITCSNQTYRIFGVEPREAEIGAGKFFNLVHPEDRDAVYSAYNKSLRMNMESFEIEHRILRKQDEDIRTVFNKCYHVRDESGSIVRSIGMVQDITEQRQKEEELRKREQEIQTIFDTVTSGIILVDKQGRIVHANKTMKEMLNYDLQNIIGSHYADYVFESEKDKAETKMYQLMDGTIDSVDLERLYQRSDGTTFWGRLSGKRQYYPDGSFWGLIGVITDITDRIQAERALGESEQQFRTLFMESPITIQIHDKETGEILDANPKAYTSYGLSTLQEFKSRDIFIEPPYSFTEALAWIRKAATEGPQQFEWLNRDIYGNYFWEQVRLVTITINGAERVMASTVDITELKQTEEALRQSEERFRLVIDATNDGVWDWDVNSDQVYYSPNYIKMLGYDSTEFPAHIQTWLDLIHPEDKEDVFKANTDCLENLTESFTVEFRMQTKNGDWKWIMGRGSAVERDHSGRATRMVGAHSDITDRKQAEQALLYAKEQAEAANRAKSEFLANMSHEIRTPINGIMGMLQLLQNSSLDEAQEKYVKTGLDSTKRLNRLLTDILDLSKIEANKLVIREDEFVFADVIKTIEDIFNQLTRENRNDISINLDDKIPEKLVGDSTRLNQILFNLVGNANKYTQNGQVELQAYLLTCSEYDRCRILFVIADNGEGIPAENIQKVFQVFTQGSDSSSYTREFEGAGLGLPLVKRLVNLMNGNISISSQEGEGTSVYVSLPFGIPESLQQDWSYLQYRQQTPEAKNLCLLLVDDDETTQLYVKDLLEMKGINTVVAGNGREGLKELEKGEFDCVLMDIQMPVLDGVEATRQIRSANSDFQKIPIIAMTAYAMSGDREKFLDKNMDDYISKPIDQDELWAVLARNLPGLKSSEVSNPGA